MDFIAAIFNIILICELPISLMGGYFVFKRIKDNKEVKEWVEILRESRDVLKQLLDEMKKRNGQNA